MTTYLTSSEVREIESIHESLIQDIKDSCVDYTIHIESMMNRVNSVYREGDIEALRVYNQLFPESELRIKFVDAAIRSIRRSELPVDRILVSEDAVKCYVELRNALIGTNQNDHAAERSADMWNLLREHPGKETLLLGFIKERRVTDALSLRELMTEHGNHPSVLAVGIL